MRTTLGIALVLMLGWSVRADEASDAIKKAIDAHGGEAVLKKATAGELAMKGTTSALGADVNFTGTTVYEIPGKYNMTLTLELAGAKTSIVQIANDGKILMKVNNLEQKVDKEMSAQLVEAAAMQEIFTLVPLLDPKKYTLKKEADEKVGENDATVITVQSKSFKDLTIYLDKKTNLLVKTKRKTTLPGGKEVVETSYHSDFKKVDSVNSAHKLKIQHDGKDFMSVDVTSSKIMEKADAKHFAVDK